MMQALRKIFARKEKMPEPEPPYPLAEDLRGIIAIEDAHTYNSIEFVDENGIPIPPTPQEIEQSRAWLHSRPAWKEMMAKMQEGDEIRIFSNSIRKGLALVRDGQSIAHIDLLYLTSARK